VKSSLLSTFVVLSTVHRTTTALTIDDSLYWRRRESEQMDGLCSLCCALVSSCIFKILFQRTSACAGHEPFEGALSEAVIPSMVPHHTIATYAYELHFYSSYIVIRNLPYRCQSSNGRSRLGYNSIQNNTGSSLCSSFHKSSLSTTDTRRRSGLGPEQGPHPPLPILCQRSCCRRYAAAGSERRGEVYQRETLNTLAKLSLAPPSGPDQ